MIPLSLYIHIPWCIRKCPYCDFNSHKKGDTLPEKAYVDALLADLKQDLARFPVRELHSIFIGGGTPSLFDARTYEILFSELRLLFSFKHNMEITMEANPGTVESSRFRDYRSIGVNRLSLGIQSFNSQHLKILGRIHDDRQAHTAIEVARTAGFSNMNLDLMYGLPKQTAQEAIADLQIAMRYQPEHLSWYQLTLEPNTVFYKQRPPLPDEDALAATEEEGFALLQFEGLERYEISAFARPGMLSQHNLNYWLFGDYLGIGAGAHGKYTADAIYRTHKLRQPNDYLNTRKAYIAETHTLKTSDRLFEFILNATRLNQALPYTLLTERTGLQFTEVEELFQKAQDRGLIELGATTWHVTPFGRKFTNDLQALFLVE